MMDRLVSYSESSDEDDTITTPTSCKAGNSPSTTEHKGVEISHQINGSAFNKGVVGQQTNSNTEEREETSHPRETNDGGLPALCREDILTASIDTNADLQKDIHSLEHPVDTQEEHCASLAERSVPSATQDYYVSRTSSRKRKLEDSDEKQMLALPSSIHCMYKDQRSVPVDDPALHQNRIRSFPHEQGNWATHVYIPVVRDERLLRFVHEVMRLLLPGQFEVLPEFHVSLSRTVVIRHHWIDPLVDSLREQLRQLKTSVCEIVDVKLFTNDEKTRTFVCLELSEEDTELLGYIKAVDNCFKDFKLAPYYQNPSFHISVGWCLGDVVSSVSCEKLSKAKEMLSKFCATHPDLSIVYAHQICCRSGNKSFVIPLKESFSRGLS